MDVTSDLTGARLDAVIESAIFGGKLTRVPTVGEPFRFFRRTGPGLVQEIPRYSESLDAAWKIVQEMRKRGYDFVFTAAAHDWWYCSFSPPPRRPSSSARAEIAPVAICWAALRAIDA